MYRVEILKGRKRNWWGVIAQNNEEEVRRCANLATHYNRKGRWLRFGRVNKNGYFEELERWQATGDAVEGWK